MLGKDSEIGTLAAIGPVANPPHSKYERLIGRAKEVPPAATANPCADVKRKPARASADVSSSAIAMRRRMLSGLP